MAASKPLHNRRLDYTRGFDMYHRTTYNNNLRDMRNLSTLHSWRKVRELGPLNIALSLTKVELSRNFALSTVPMSAAIPPSRQTRPSQDALLSPHWSIYRRARTTPRTIQVPSSPSDMRTRTSMMCSDERILESWVDLLKRKVFQL